jgi:hypothetical protein
LIPGSLLWQDPGFSDPSWRTLEVNVKSKDGMGFGQIIHPGRMPLLESLQQFLT